VSVTCEKNYRSRPRNAGAPCPVLCVAGGAECCERVRCCVRVPRAVTGVSRAVLSVLFPAEPVERARGFCAESRIGGEHMRGRSVAGARALDVAVRLEQRAAPEVGRLQRNRR
jgi:hypothetical protein